MAKIKTNPVLKEIHGKIGDLVFKRWNKEAILSQKGVPTGTPTPAQLDVRGQFRLATVYGKAAMADPAKHELYEAKHQATGMPVFALMVADFFHAPAVDTIDLSQYTGKTGDVIHITASDDFEVADVNVVIHDTNGAVLEQGVAAKGANDSSWTYTATTDLPTGQNVSIDVTATDLPGNKTTKTQAR